MLEGYQRDLVLKHVEIQDSTETQNAGFPWRNGRGGKPRAMRAGRPGNKTVTYPDLRR